MNARRTRLIPALAATTREALGKIAASTIGLLAASGAMRLAIWWQAQTAGHPIRAYLLTAPIYNAADILTGTALGAAFAVAALLVRRHASGIARSWFWLALVLALLDAINVPAVYWLRGPITFQWLYYADLLRSFTAQSVVGAVVGGGVVALLVIAAATFFATSIAAAALIRLAAARGRGGVTLGAIVALLALGSLYAATRQSPIERFRGTFANPLAEFVASSWASVRHSLSGPADTDTSDYRIGMAPQVPVDPRRRPRNVILIIMESAGARFVLGPQAQPLPNIAALRRIGMTYITAYATTAASTRSNFAIMAARYPRFSYRPETYSLSSAPLMLLPGRLKRAGYDTAFFMGGDFAFQGVDHFLGGKGFDYMADVSSIPCARRIHAGSARWTNVDHVSDDCVTDALLRWTGAQRTKPFLAVLWNNDTHFPYSPAGAAPGNPKARYLAALRDLDGQIGRIISAVRDAGKLDDTLFVLVGDHGEAFEEHGNFGHGSTVFEEETHVPLIVANPQLFAGGSDARLASLIDIAPTILAANGLPPEPSWEGRDLLDPPTRRRLYIFAVQRDFIAGYREGDTKTVDNLRYGTIDRYDLSRDPLERHPVRLSGVQASDASAHLAGWAQYQERLYTQH